MEGFSPARRGDESDYTDSPVDPIKAAVDMERRERKKAISAANEFVLFARTVRSSQAITIPAPPSAPIPKRR